MVVYKITNTVNNKIYVGCAVNYDKRMKEHKSCKYKGALLLHKAFLKHKIENFTFEIVESYSNKEEMLLGEIDHIKKLNTINPCGYNLHYGGKGGKIQLTEQQFKERQNHAKSLTKLHIGNKYNLGRIPSIETKEKLSKALKGKTRSDLTKSKMSESKKGNSYAKGNIRTEEYKKKLSDSLKGRVFTEEHKKAMSESAKKRMVNKKRNNDGRFQ